MFLGHEKHFSTTNIPEPQLTTPVSLYFVQELGPTHQTILVLRSPLTTPAAVRHHFPPSPGFSRVTTLSRPQRLVEGPLRPYRGPQLSRPRRQSETKLLLPASLSPLPLSLLLVESIRQRGSLRLLPLSPFQPLSRPLSRSSHTRGRQTITSVPTNRR